MYYKLYLCISCKTICPRNAVCFVYIIVDILYKEIYNNNRRAIVSRNKRCDHSVCDHWRMVQDANIRTRHNVTLCTFSVMFILFPIVISLAEYNVGIRDCVSLVEGSSAENNVRGGEWRCAVGGGCVGGTT
jgi:hypothetical protein